MMMRRSPAAQDAIHVAKILRYHRAAARSGHSPRSAAQVRMRRERRSSVVASPSRIMAIGRDSPAKTKPVAGSHRRTLIVPTTVTAPSFRRPNGHGAQLQGRVRDRACGPFDRNRPSIDGRADRHGMQVAFKRGPVSCSGCRAAASRLSRTSGRVLATA